MKKLLILFMLVIPSALFSQEYLPMDADTKIVSYKEIVEAEGTKGELFDKAKTWAIKTYNNYQSVSQLEDKEVGKIVLKGMIDASVSTIIQSRVHYVLTIECKDGRYRATIDDMYGEDKISGSWSKMEMWMYNGLLKNSLKTLSSDQFKEEDLDATKHNSARYQGTIKKINSTMNGLLSSLKEAMTVQEEEW